MATSNDTELKEYIVNYVESDEIADELAESGEFEEGQFILTPDNEALEKYPVGAIFITSQPDDPAELFGGKWEQIQDRMLLGAGNTYTEIYKDNGDGTYNGIGGSANAVVVSHSHFLKDEQSQYLGYHTGVSFQAGRLDYNQTINNIGGRFKTETVGEDGTGKNMPPYAIVYMWYRYE